METIKNLKDYNNDKGKILLNGVDSLYLTADCTIKEDFLNKLKRLKEIMDFNETEQTTLKINGFDFYLKNHGTRGYKFIFLNDCFNINLTERPSVKDYYPNLKINISSKYLWSEGFVDAYAKVEKLLNSVLNLREIRISRVDLAVDLADVDDIFSKYNLSDNMVSRAKTLSTHSNLGRKITGWSVGKRNSDVYCRMYNKSKEIKDKKNKKAWFYDLYNENGYNAKEDGDVWRVEFELKRGALRSFEINSIDDLFENGQAIWQYLTKKWFSLRIKDNVRYTRRTVFKLWDEVSNIEFIDFDTSSNKEIVRNKEKKAGLKLYADMIIGCLSSIAAMQKKFDSEFDTPYQIFEKVLKHLRQEKKDYSFKYDILSKKPKFQLLTSTL